MLPVCICVAQVGSCLGSFLKSFGDAALPYVEGLMPSIAPLLDKARPDEERRIAMCIIDDMLEHSAQGRAKYLSQVRVGQRERGTHTSAPFKVPCRPKLASVLLRGSCVRCMSIHSVL